MKLIVALASLLFSVLAISGAVAALRDGTNFAIRPESLKCINIEVPDDFGPVGAPTEFEIKSDCLEWCDFTSAAVFTDPGNPTSIPVCFNTFNREVNQTKQIKFTIDARQKQKEFNYGICVADQQDQDSGSGNPCNVVNTNQKYFEISMEPITYVEAGIEGEYEIQVYSPIAIELEVTVEDTGKIFTLTTRPQEKIVLRDKIKIERDTILNVKAVVKGCSLPTCLKTASTLLSTQKPAPYSGNFSASLMPEAATTKKGLPAKYYLEIRNYGEEKEYAIQLSLPLGLKSSFNSTTKSILNRENVKIEIIPEGTECLYTFSINVKGQVAKTLQGSLSVDEAVCDLRRAKATEVLDPSKLSSINEAIIKAKDSSLSEDIGIFTDFTVKTVEQTPVVETDQPKKPKAPAGGIDLTTIIIIVAVVVLGLVFVLIKKGKKVGSGEDEEYSESRRY